MKKFSIILIYFILLTYLEMIFRITSTTQIFTLSIFHTLLYIGFISTILGIITCLFNKKTNKIIFNILLFIICTWFVSHMIFASKFGVYLSITSVGLSDQILSFQEEIFKTLIDNWYLIILGYIPFILTISSITKYELTKSTKKLNIIYMGVIVALYLLFSLSLLIGKKDTYSPYNLINKIDNINLLVEKVGVLPTTFVEVKRIFIELEEEIIDIDNPIIKDDLPLEVKYNTTDIDFEALNAKTDNKTLQSMNNYFSSLTGSNQNEYTGYFEGKNLVLVMAESFTHVAISESITPTLYKLTNEGFIFENFYSPVILSTIGGEFQELTGLYPNINLLSSVWRKGTNYFPYGHANIFESLGYQTYAYHNNQYNFQNRDKYLSSLGFDNYKGCFNGLEKDINCYQWPQSDQEMVLATTSDYLNQEQPFMTYYVTVSGHMAYTWGNAMSKKHQDVVEDLEYSEEVKAYIATQVELDRALESLIEELEKSGELKDTVIALVSDHYPYDLSLDQINEMSTYQRDGVVELNRNAFIMWNSEMEPIKIDKVGSQIDVLPTILNLFNAEYDSRLIIGQDILSNEPGLAIFSNNSWVSDYGTYFSASNKFVPKEGIEVPENYVNDMNSIVRNKILMSKYIIEYDYYDFALK